MTHKIEVVSATFQNSTQADEAISATASVSGSLGFQKDSTVDISAISLANPLVVTTSSNHNLTQNCGVRFAAINGTTQLNNNIYYVKPGDASDSDTSTKFRIYDTLSEGVPQSISISAAGSSYNNNTYTNIATTNVDTSSEASGLTLDLTVAGNQITVATINTAGSGYHKNDIVVPTIPGPGSGGQISVSAVDYELGTPVDGSSGFSSYTSGGSILEVNPIKVFVEAALESPTKSATIPNSELTVIPRSVSNPYYSAEWLEFQVEYGSGDTYSTFQAVVEGYGLYTGAAVSQGDYASTITFVGDAGTHAYFNAGYSTTVSSSTDVSIIYNTTDGVDIASTDYILTQQGATNTQYLSGNTEDSVTNGDITASIKVDTYAPAGGPISGIANLDSGSTLEVTTTVPHGLYDGVPVQLSGVIIRTPSPTFANIVTTALTDAGVNFYAKRVDEDTIQLYEESTLITPKVGTDFSYAPALSGYSVEGFLIADRASIIAQANLQITSTA
jgi:hypothetical protein